MKKKIHQFVDTLVPGDAISNYSIQIMQHLQRKGYESHIYTRATLVVRKEIKYFRQEIDQNAAIIFHHSTITPFINKLHMLPNKKALIYHNITPAAFFREYNYKNFILFQEAERQNYMLRQIDFEALIGDSQHNLDIIKQWTDAEYTDVIPPFLKLQFLKKKEKLKKSITTPFTIMFVGRFAPNKRQLDIIKAFEFYSRFINRHSKLVLIGNFSRTDAYFSEIETFIKKRNIRNIEFKIALSSDELAEAYATADVFLSMSEHEGFCIPVLEAIYLGVPVLAFKIPALGELLDNKYMFESKNFEEVGKRLYTIQTDKKYRKKMITDQQKVLEKFDEKIIKEKFDLFIKTAFNL